MIKRLFASFVFALALVCNAGTAHAARFWVDNTLGEVAEADKATVSVPQPVQLLFQFTTNEQPNARAVKYLAPKVTDLVQNSRLFSDVSAGPAANGAIISITIDNFGDAKAAASKGFATGLTFGLKGTTVADNYLAKIEYVSGVAGTANLTKEVRHQLWTTIGNTDAPPNTTQVKNVEEASQTVFRQIVNRLLNDLAKDPAFSGKPAMQSPPPIGAQEVALPVAGVPVESVAAPAGTPSSP